MSEISLGEQLHQKRKHNHGEVSRWEMYNMLPRTLVRECPVLVRSIGTTETFARLQRGRATLLASLHMLPAEEVLQPATLLVCTEHDLSCMLFLLTAGFAPASWLCSFE